jgi:hypothetical protein
MPTRQNIRDCGILIFLAFNLVANSGSTEAQQSDGFATQQPAAMPADPAAQDFPSLQKASDSQVQRSYVATPQVVYSEPQTMPSVPQVSQAAYGGQQVNAPRINSQPQHVQPIHRDPNDLLPPLETYSNPQFNYHSPHVATNNSVQPYYALADQPTALYNPSTRRVAPISASHQHDLMATNKHTLLQYRRLFRNGSTPSTQELVGKWNGVNKGIVEIAGYRQFVKDIRIDADGQVYGDNIQVNQVQPGQIQQSGWAPKFDYRQNDYERRGRFAVQTPQGRGYFGHGATFSYANGRNQRNDPARLLMDQVVRIDENHMLGRATANFGPFRIPLAYFVLERRSD